MSPRTLSSCLAFTPKYNTKAKRDATGAFIPEARRFAKLHGGKVVLFDNRKVYPARAKTVLEALEKEAASSALVPVQVAVGPDAAGGAGAVCGARVPLVIGFFCHGLRRSLQAGFRSHGFPRNVGDLANKLTALSLGVGSTEASPQPPPLPIHVVLYACDAGKPDGLAELLARELYDRGVSFTLDAHTTAGHTTRNPYVVRYEGVVGLDVPVNSAVKSKEERFAGKPGSEAQWLIAPGSTHWPAWKRALRGTGDLRLRFPLMSREEILAELQRP